MAAALNLAKVALSKHISQKSIVGYPMGPRQFFLSHHHHHHHHLVYNPKSNNDAFVPVLSDSRYLI